ncbi:CRISPR-associated protein Cas2 [Pullulanibacillus pueri]|uniref:CRISPR-associated endoribonuclease Cas2 n=1 Tax=Pullulanibacillus pueri TaxID=1437324 RepID=A0A8J2ZUS8_9BACL|nr:CRISPR-associated endonuclease Cas2 [Pullulanibacillus pueri]MBM7682117.1 CRISPR-associated protein Cas2 [Pullulanibacillus pueri]GGH79913.1 CRISPR-associated endoribonuclease Cas2 [Pullulanibacillus pueri]
MLVVITYDVSTVDGAGKKRLRRVSKLCQNYGQRVQNSVFECVVDSTQLKQLKYELLEVINSEKDSLRFYRLGDNYKTKVEHIGVKDSFDVEGPLFI